MHPPVKKRFTSGSVCDIVKRARSRELLAGRQRRNDTMKEKKNQFSGQIGFVLAAAGSAVGVGNLWRFPYLAAKDGADYF